MDKYEYQLKLDQLKNLVAAEDYETAAEIANSINWKKVRNSKTLTMVADVYEKMGQYDACRDVLLQAYDHSSIGRNIVRRLAEVAIKAKNVSEAEEYYHEFLEIAPHDNQKYVLAYKISCLKDAPLTDRIAVLEELKEKEYTEVWAYELAALYGQAGMREKCVETCDELILWFGEGEYVEKALDLKRSFQPLTPAQEKKYQKFRSQKGIVEINIPKKVEARISEDNGLPELTVTASKFNTQNLQEELARSMQQIMNATEKETVSDTMDNIKKIVNDIPYLNADPEQEEAPVFDKEKINEKVDASLKEDFREMLGEESDGQISLQIPEDTAREQQVEGQMSIEEVLTEWEKTKRAAEAAIAAAEQKKLDMAKEQALSEASEIMNRLKALFPVLSATPGEDIPEKPETVADTLIPSEEEKKAMAAASASAAETGQDGQPEAAMPAGGEPEAAAAEAASTCEETADPEAVDEAAEVPEAAVELEAEPEAPEAAADTEAEPEKQDETADTEAEPEMPGETADTQTESAVSETDQAAETDGESLSGDAQDTREMPDLSAAALQTQAAEETPAARFEEPSGDEELEKLLATATRVMMENSNVEVPVSGGRPAEEKQEEEQENLPEIQPAEEIPEEEPAARGTAADAEPEEEILTEEDRELFSYFLPVPGMEEQIVQILRDAKKYKGTSITSLRGNLIVQGEEGSGKTVLATSLIKAIQKIVGNEDAKIGKISASALNRKDFAALVPKIAGGYLIVDKAGELTEETAVRMSKVMERNTKGMVVILEDDSAGIKKALNLDFSFSKKFTGKVKIPIFTIDELVDFGKSYAHEMECVIEEMGVLALYNRINNIQKLERATTLAEVKEIVDQAIESAESGGLKKLFTKKYDENDYLILREKDFEQ